MTTRLLLKEVNGLSTYLLSLPDDKRYFDLDEMQKIFGYINNMVDVIYARKVS